ncbi:hypothetical protein K2173_021340 [Erythroxylum novogranatense]|uniref:50S ribosomal protein L7/L12 n=1 Tax=Erythroxylum novogranatense TaxID=1862640 RepID=A0AAV8TX45_9ROSI|nr:hypothetical protein K2173_021340 [Erythroxylum novogranatense]
MRILRLISPRISRFTATHLQNPNWTLQSELKPCSSTARGLTSAVEAIPPAQSGKVSEIVNELAGLTLLEISDLTEVLRTKMDVKDMPVMAVMMPGMGFSGLHGAMRGGGGASATAAAEEKVEKTVFDLKLEGFDAAAKIKVIKEVRGFTDLGLKEAKELVEKAPTFLKKGVTKDEAEKIIAKMKDAGAKVSME